MDQAFERTFSISPETSTGKAAKKLKLPAGQPMHPNAYLQHFWKMELKPQVFVAMTFGGIYDDRFNDVIAPAIKSIAVGGLPLQPFRVDTSKSGDSILTDIAHGIAHSRFVLADISTLGNDLETGKPYRNANVMYEVGIALACRQSHDVLLVRDDFDPFLFDVSTIPTLRIKFADAPSAVAALNEELVKRLSQQQFMDDTRVQMAVAGLTGEELAILKQWNEMGDIRTVLFGRPNTGVVDFVAALAIPRLLDKGIIRVSATFDAGHPAYQFTPLGIVAAQRALKHLPTVASQTPPPEPAPQKPIV